MTKLPLSGRLLGSIFAATAVPSDVLAKGMRALAPEGEASISGTTIREYFAGKRIGARSRERILLYCAHLLSRSELVPCPPEAGLSKHERELGIALHSWADSWDLMVTAWEAFRFSEKMQLSAAKGAFRLCAIDLAMRVAGIARFLAVAQPDALPRWARFAVQASGRGTFLKDLLRGTGLTLESFAARLNDGMSDRALDYMLSGDSRPTEEHLSLIARRLSHALPSESWLILRAHLGRHYALHDLAQAVAALLGWDFVAELYEALLITWRETNKEIASLAAEGQKPVSAALFDLGCHMLNDRLQRRLCEAIPGIRWREAVRAVTGNWLGYLIYEARRRERADDAFDVAKVPATAAEWSLRGYYALANMDDAAGIASFRRALKLDPADAELHMDLACSLDGAHLDDGPGGERRRLEEALMEARIAQGLRPGWQEPILMEAIFVEALGDPAAALTILERVLRANAAGNDELSIRYHAAVMAFRANRPQVALNWLKEVLRLAPNHAEALALAAMSHQRLGHEREAQKRAEQAAVFGRHGAVC